MMRQPDSLQTYAHILQHVGWDPSALRFRRQFEVRTNPESETMPARLVSLMQESLPIASLFVIDGVRLPSGITLYQRFLDMSIEGRLGLRAAAHFSPAPYLLIASPYECFLYETQGEELLLSATSPEDSAMRIFSHFDASGTCPDSLERIPRRNSQQWGKELADWLNIWCVKLGRSARIAPAVMRSLLLHWLIAWKDTLATTADRVPDNMNAIVLAADDPSIASASKPSPADYYNQHVLSITARMPFGIFLAFAEMEQRLWNDESIADLLSDFLAEARLLSRSKFLSANVLYALTSDKTENKSWKKSLTEFAKTESKLTRTDLTILEPVCVNVAEEGYGWGLRLIEDLVRYWLEQNLQRKKDVEHLGGLNVQLDLFARSPAGLNAAGFLDNVLTFVVSNCFRGKVASAEERFNFALLVSLKLYELAEAYSLPLGSFPEINSIFDE